MIRISIVEYGTPFKLNYVELQQQLGLTKLQINDLFLRAGVRAGKLLGFRYNPISIIEDRIRAVDIVGILRISKDLELEISPKFLGVEMESPNWREDFFFLSMISKHGNLLLKDKLSARTGDPVHLHTLMARSMIDLYWENHRRPLRTYNKQRIFDFAIDGDFDAESLILPDSEGFEQFTLRFSNNNHFNSVILSAARQLLPSILDQGTAKQLERIIHGLSPQEYLPDRVRKMRLPSRSIRWQTLYELSLDILNGFGVSLSSGLVRAPGYVLDSWRIWQDLIELAAKIGYGYQRVSVQSNHLLGKRYRLSNDIIVNSRDANVTPDILLHEISEAIPKLIIDAKYKTNMRNDQSRISEGDVYESLAFANATDCPIVLLLYPAKPSLIGSLGELTPFEVVQVGTVRIIGAEVNVKNISQRDGLRRFSQKYVSSIRDVVEKWR